MGDEHGDRDTETCVPQTQTAFSCTFQHFQRALMLNSPDPKVFVVLYFSRQKVSSWNCCENLSCYSLGLIKMISPTKEKANAAE